MQTFSPAPEGKPSAFTREVGLPSLPSCQIFFAALQTPLCFFAALQRRASSTIARRPSISRYSFTIFVWSFSSFVTAGSCRDSLYFSTARFHLLASTFSALVLK